MKITKITHQVKNQRRYSIYIDEKYGFSLSESQLAESRLHVGQELGKGELKEYRNQSDLGKLYERALKWLAIRPRSEWEIDTYLIRICKVRPCKEVKQKLINLDMVNDEKFAESWVMSRRAFKPISRRKLWLELKQKRISSDIIEQTLAEDETDEREVLGELVARKRKQAKYQDDLKLMQYLSRQGYRYNDIKDVLEEQD